MEVGLHNSHVVIKIKLNFLLDLKKKFAAKTLQVLIQLYKANMQPGKVALALHHTMTYNIQSHLLSMDHSLIPTVQINGDVNVQIQENLV